jgi:SDR family mycofactocin-dependent oxidoreductase
MGRVDGKVAFITGAARGIGRAHAVRLAQEGADVIAIDLLDKIDGAAYGPATEDDLAETVRQVEQFGRRIVATKADVRDLDELTQALDEGVAQLGRLDIVCANAGIMTAMVPTDQLEEDAWREMIDTNLSGVWRTVKAAIPHLKRGGRGGSIILTSSMAGLRGFANVAHYVSAKHGVVGLMRTLAIELAPELIRVNSVHPTQTNTDMIQNQQTYDLFTGKPGSTREEFEAVSKGQIPMPIPWVEPVDIANAMIFLASDEARYITGVPLPVDGGNSLI